MRFCSATCTAYPCKRLQALDKRYQTKYGVSLIENLECIMSRGIRKFIAGEKKKWCKGDKIFCIHDKQWHTK
jgi:hypothetical protein